MFIYISKNCFLLGHKLIGDAWLKDCCMDVNSLCIQVWLLGNSLNRVRFVFGGPQFLWLMPMVSFFCNLLLPHLFLLDVAFVCLFCFSIKLVICDYVQVNWNEFNNFPHHEGSNTTVCFLFRIAFSVS